MGKELHNSALLKTRSRLTILGFVLAFAVLFITVACVSTFGGPRETRDDDFSVGENMRIVVSTDNGKIEVEAGTKGAVNVGASIRRPDDVDYTVTQEGDTIRVEAKIRRFSGIGTSPGADVTITAPPDANVDLRTSNGAIEVEGMTESGKLRTSNGAIVLDDVRGEFDANTSNGRIDFTGEMTSGGTNSLTTSNGRVNVTLTGTPSIELDASTSNGKVTCELPILATSTGDKHLEGTIGNGDAELRIRTSNGSITVQ